MPVTTPDRFPLWLRGTLCGLILVACALLAYEIPNRGIDPDELEHLHAAYCVWRGEVPYRDFFEHHGPALYYCLWPLLEICGPKLSVLWIGRLAMWCCALATLWLTGRLASRWGGLRAGLLAMCLLAWTTIFQAKGIELRPDVPAMLLVVVAVGQFTYATGGGSWRRFLYVGLLCGLATLFTQKSIVPVAGIAAAACLARLVTRAGESESAGTVLARVIVPIAAGIAAVWGLATALFATCGAATDFWYSTWYQLWIWPIRSSRWENLRPTLAGDLTVWVAALFEILVVLRQLRHTETWQNQRGVVVVIVAACLASLLFVKATYPQFYLLWIPLMAALAAGRIVAIRDAWSARGSVFLVIASGTFLVVFELVIWERAYHAGFAGALPRLGEMEAANPPIVLALAIVAAGIAALAFARKWDATALLIATAGMGYGVLRDIDKALWSNRNQVAAIEAVNRQVPPDGRVLDGFNGYGALRPHAWYYWWINEYSLALIPEAERDAKLLTALEKNPPAAVLFDKNLKLLSPRVLEWIHAHYEPVELTVLWLPKKGNHEFYERRE